MRLAAWSLATLFSIVLAPACSGKYTTIPEPGDGQSKVFDCSDYLACDLDTPCDGGECLSISGCSSAICVSASVVCDQACDSTSCVVLDSYPGQITSCPDGTPIKGKGQGLSIPTPGGTGGGPSYAGSVPAGGYGTAGTGVYPAGGYGTGAYPSGGYGGYATGGYGVSGAGGAANVNCQAFTRCSFNTPCTGASFDCISLPGCQLGICAPAFPLCNALCAGDCAVLDSYPAQLECSTGRIYGYEGFAGYGGTSWGGAPGNYGGESSYAGDGGDSAGAYGGAP